MVIMLSGTPTTAGTSSQIDCLDEAGEPFKLVLRVIAPTDSGTANCYLKRYDRNGTCTMLMLPNIQSIEETDTANLTEISTIIYGFDNNFVMDLGTTQRFTVTLKRNQPSTVNDDDDYTHSEQWSNGHWYQKLCDFISGWQNLNCGFVTKVRNNQTVREFMQTGGFTFHFEPQEESFRGEGAIYSDMYPVIDKNVFIAGQISMSYSGSNLQYLNISLPLAVSTMVRNQAGQEMRELSYFLSTDVDAPRFKQLFPEGIPSVAPYGVPSAWLSSSRGRYLEAWYARGYSSKLYLPGTSVPIYTDTTPPSLITDMIVKWADCKYAWYKDPNGGTSSIDFTGISGVTRLTYWLIGGGGDGGMAGVPGQSSVVDAAGGGGGSGGYRNSTMPLTDAIRGAMLSISLAVGVDAGSYDAGSSTLTITYANDGPDQSPFVITAEAGGRGEQAPNMGIGRGGTSGAGGVDGSAGERGPQGHGGVGGDLSQYIYEFYIVPSASGQSRVPPGSDSFSSIATPADKTPAQQPATYGAGGKGGYQMSGPGRGGPGLVIVALS